MSANQPPTSRWHQRESRKHIQPSRTNTLPAQRAHDNRMIKAIAARTLWQRDPYTGETISPSQVFAPSRANFIELKDETCQPVKLRVGGYVTRWQAQLEFPQPESTPAVPVLALHDTDCTPMSITLGGVAAQTMVRNQPASLLKAA